MTTFLEQYKANLDKIVADKLAGTQATGNSSLANAYALLKQQSGPAVGYETGANIKANESGLHKALNAGKSGGLRILDLLSRADYAVMNTIKETSQPGPNDENPLEAFLKGFSGKEKTTGADVLKQNYPEMGNVNRGITGFVGDVFLDPTTYIGAGAIKSLGRGALKGAEAAGLKVGKKAAEDAITKPADKALAEVTADGSTQVEKNTAVNIVDSVAPQVQSSAPEMPFNRVFVGGEQGITKTAAPKALETRVPFGDELKLVTARSAVQKVTDTLGAIPGKRYAPGTKIEPMFKTVIKNIKEQVPAAAVKEAAKEVAPKATRRVAKSAMTAERARASAFYQHLISNPTVKFTLPTKSGQSIRTSVAELRQAAKAGRDITDVNNIVKLGALHLAKQSPEFFSDTPLVSLLGRTGEAGGHITVDDFQKLLQTGEVPKPVDKVFRQAGEQVDQYSRNLAEAGGYTGNDAALAKFAIHDPEDLKNFHLSDLQENPEVLADYLKRMNVPLKNVKVEPGKMPLQAASEGLGGVFDNPPTFPTTQKAVTQAGKPTTKVTKVSQFAKLNRNEKKAWLAAHVDILDAEDIQALDKVAMTATDSKAWNAAVKKILAKQNTSGFKTVDELMTAIEDGRVNPDDLKDLMKILNVRSPKNIKKGMERLLKHTEDLEGKVGKAKAAAQEDIWATKPPEPVAPPVEVKPAKTIVEDVIQRGDKTDLLSEKQNFDPKQYEDFNATLKYAVDHEIIDPRTATKYGYETRTGVRRTSPTMHKGAGRKLDEWNKMSQYTVIKGLMARRSKEVSQLISKSGLKGDTAKLAYRDAMYEHVMPIMRTMDKILKENGIPPKLNDAPDYIASVTDVLDSMPTDFVKKHFFDRSSITRTRRDGKKYTVTDNEHIPPTMWNELGEIVMDYSRGHLDEMHAREGIGLELLRTRITHNGKKVFAGGIIKNHNAIVKANGEEAGKAYLDSIANTFLGGAQHLAQAVERNTAEVVVHNVNGAAKISNETYDAFLKLIQSPGFSGHDLLQVANNRDAIMESVAKAAGVTNQAAKDIAKADVLVKTSGVIPPEVAAQARTTEKAGAAAARGDSKGVAASLSDNLDNVESSIRNMQVEEGESLIDLGLNNERTLGYAVIRAFGPHFKNGDVRPWFLSRNSAGQTVARTFSAKLSDITKRHAKDDINAAWNEIRLGTRATPDSPVGAAQADLEQVVNSLFGGSEKENIFTANGLTAHQVNNHFQRFGIPDKYAFEPSISPLEQWRTWESTDPLNLISKVQAAIQTSIVERQVGADLSRRFGSATKQEGFVKIASGRGSILANYLRPDYYFPRDIASQMSELDKFMREMNKPASSNKLLNIYDTVIHSYKSGLTIYRPGHHVRNMVGDITFSWLAGVNDPRVYNKALKVMVQNKGRYHDFDALRALSLGRESQAPINASGKILTTRIGGKTVDLTSGQVYEMAYKHGILPDYRTLEDIQFGADKNFKMPRPLKGKAHNVAATVSESRDHYIRIAHFIDVLQKGKFKDMEQAALDAASVVRKWHPDGSDLTHFESKVMRRGFLFYSWIRKAIPLVAESMVMKPGKVMIYPKAMYNMAEAMGLNPDSLGNPFPEDQLFPQWISDMVTGPQFRFDNNMWAVNPGMPVADVLNDYANSPRDAMKTVLGSTTPFFKIPVELATADPGNVAKDLRTGAPVKDASDYADRQIPGFNVLANVTNRSPSSLFTQGTGESSGMSPEQIQAAQEKNKPGLDVPALLNLLFGGGLMNMTKPNYVRQAQIEQNRRQ